MQLEENSRFQNSENWIFSIISCHRCRTKSVKKNRNTKFPSEPTFVKTC